MPQTFDLRQRIAAQEQLVHRLELHGDFKEARHERLVLAQLYSQAGRNPDGSAKAPPSHTKLPDAPLFGMSSVFQPPGSTSFTGSAPYDPADPLGLKRFQPTTASPPPKAAPVAQKAPAPPKELPGIPIPGTDYHGFRLGGGKIRVTSPTRGTFTGTPEEVQNSADIAEYLYKRGQSHFTVRPAGKGSIAVTLLIDRSTNKPDTFTGTPGQVAGQIAQAYREESWRRYQSARIKLRGDTLWSQGIGAPDYVGTDEEPIPQLTKKDIALELEGENSPENFMREYHAQQEVDEANRKFQVFHNIADSINTGVGKVARYTSPISYISPGTGDVVEHIGKNVASFVNPMSAAEGMTSAIMNPKDTLVDTGLGINKIWGRTEDGKPVSVNDRIDGLFTLGGTGLAVADVAGLLRGKSALPFADHPDPSYRPIGEVGVEVPGRPELGKTLSIHDSIKVMEARQRGKGSSTTDMQTPEREMMRQTKIDQAYQEDAPIKPKKKQAWIVIGKPAAGKSSVIVNRLTQELKPVLVDSDRFKKVLPEYDNGYGNTRVAPESSKMAAQLLERAVKEGNNIVWPQLGRYPMGLANQLTRLKSQGYETHLVLVEVQQHTSIARAMQRFYDGRQGFIDPHFIESEVGNSPEQNFDKLRSMADFYEHYLSEGKRIRLIRRGRR